MTKINF